MKKLFLSLLTVTLLSISFANSCLANENKTMRNHTGNSLANANRTIFNRSGNYLVFISKNKKTQHIIKNPLDIPQQLNITSDIPFRVICEKDYGTDYCSGYFDRSYRVMKPNESIIVEFYDLYGGIKNTLAISFSNLK
jgi:hypothetical protein